MCLVKVKQEEDVVVPYRVVKRDRSPRRNSHYSTQRVSRTEVYHEHSPRPSASYVAVPAPKPLAIPAPQPVPVFVQEPPPPPPPMPAPMPHHHHHQQAHYVEVSPGSSVTSYSPERSEYVTREREYRRERNYSPDSPRYEHFRYVEPAPSESDHYDRYERRSRSRVRERSRSRARDYEYDHDPRGSYRETNTRITIVDDDGRRRREYRR